MKEKMNRRRPAVNLRLNWLRRILEKLFLHSCFDNEGRRYWLSVLWSFLCGYSIQDSFFYDHRTPRFIKKFIIFTKKYLRV